VIVMPDFPLGCLWYVLSFAAGVIVDRLAHLKLSDLVKR